MKRAWLVALALSCALGGCAEVRTAESYPAPALDDEVASAEDSYALCVWNTAERLDDGKENVLALALKVLPLCDMKFAQLEAVTGRGADPFAQGVRRQSAKLDKEMFAADIVRRQRLNRAFAR